MSDQQGLNELVARGETLRGRRNVPPPRYRKPPVTPSEPTNDHAAASMTPVPAEPEQTNAAKSAPGAPTPPLVLEPEVPRRTRVRPTQVHLDEASEAHLRELRQQAVLADVAFTASAVLRLALAELVERHGYRHIVELLAQDAGRPKPAPRK